MQHRPFFRAPRLALALTASRWLASAAHADTVTVVTSFPKELTPAYKKAFEKANPTTRSRS